eukprot:Pgem_evm1s6740
MSSCRMCNIPDNCNAPNDGAQCLRCLLSCNNCKAGFYLENQICLQYQQAFEICVDEDVYTVENGTCINNNSNGSNVGLIVGVSVG